MKKYKYVYINKPIPIDINVSEQLIRLRKQKGYTQTQLAEKCGVSKNTISSIENNNFLPSLTLVIALCLALDCKFNDLVETYSCCDSKNIYL